MGGDERPTGGHDMRVRPMVDHVTRYSHLVQLRIGGPSRSIIACAGHYEARPASGRTATPVRVAHECRSYPEQNHVPVVVEVYDSLPALVQGGR